MGWPEVKQAADEHRYELVLSGATVSERIDKSGLDKDIFELTFLNFLQISNTTLLSLPVELGQLVKLKTLDLHKNSLKELPASIGLLKELKHLDLSDNKLQKLPTTLTELNLLQSLNLNCNQLTELPSFVLLTSLKRVDISHNQLKELPDGIYELEHLSEIIASYNQISNISGNISKLPALKVLSLNANKIELLPSELTDCLKLKDLHLQDNSIQDRRLFKVIKQCSTKAVLDYIATRSEKVKAGKKGGKKGRSRKVSEGADNEVSADQAEAQFFNPVVRVMHSEEFKVVSQSSVKVVRPYIVCAVVRNLDLIDADAYKKFINIQTKLHESICDHRTSATIATHDIAPLAFPLEYEACPPSDIQLVPLGRQEEITAEQLITDLRAEAMRQKQKTKRNPFKTGLFKYLTLIEGAESYAVLRDSSRAVVSLPPVTNCDKSKITGKKIDVLLEVTSPVSLETCKTVMDSLIKMMLEVGLFSEANTLVDDVECATSLSNQELVIEQVRVLGSDGQLRVVYPSRVDLQFESVKVIRPEKV